MFVLRLLGGASLDGPHGPVTGRVAQRRRLALLAALATARGRPVSRDKLVTLFWPEHDAQAARHLLRDALYIVRSSLGEEAVVAVGDDLRLDPAHVTSDVEAFERALDADDAECAARLYAGPFLDGVHVTGAPAFEHWSDAERTRLAQRHCAALDALARAADAANDPARAVVWWRRLAAAEPLNGAAALGLVRALDATGHRPAALQHVRVHAALLAQELGTTPDPALLALAEELRRETARNDGPPLRSMPVPVSVDPAAAGAPVAVAQTPAPAEQPAPARPPAPAPISPPVPPAAPLPAPASMRTRAALPARGRARDPVLLAGMLAGAVCGATAASRWDRAHAAPAPRPVRVVLSDADGPSADSPTLTHDGSTVVFARQDGGGLVVRALGALAARPVPGTEGARNPFASRDGRGVAFFTDGGQLEQVPLDGTTAPNVLAAARGFSSASWGPGGVLVIDQGPGAGLGRVVAPSGGMRALTRVDTARGEWEHAHPRVLPDGRAVVFVDVRRAGGWPLVGELAVAPLDEPVAGSVPHTGLGVVSRGVVDVVDDRLVYIAGDGSALLAAPFDASTHRITGPPTAVLRDPEGPVAAATLASDGTLLYTHGSASTGRTLALVDAHGASRPLVHLAPVSRNATMYPRLSPDGRRIALMRPAPEGGADIWVYDVASGTPTRLTSGGRGGLPEWTPDGQRIVFASENRGRSTIWWQAADGSARAERLFDVDGLVRGAPVTPDGHGLVFAQGVHGSWSIWSVRLDGDPRSRIPRPVVTGPYSTAMPAISPDGRWLAYTSSESGRDEVYVRPFPGPGAAVQASDHGGVEPVWGRDGRRLYYRTGQAMVAASVRTGPAFVVRSRDSLFRDVFTGGMPHANYAVMPDGQHFVVLETGEGPGAAAVVVVNWLPAFRAALAAGRPTAP